MKIVFGGKIERFIAKLEQSRGVNAVCWIATSLLVRSKLHQSTNPESQRLGPIYHEVFSSIQPQGFDTLGRILLSTSDTN